MPRRTEFVEYVTDLMQPMGPVHARAMFGGYGVYLIAGPTQWQNFGRGGRLE